MGFYTTLMAIIGGKESFISQLFSIQTAYSGLCETLKRTEKKKPTGVLVSWLVILI